MIGIATFYSAIFITCLFIDGYGKREITRVCNVYYKESLCKTTIFQENVNCYAVSGLLIVGGLVVALFMEVLMVLMVGGQNASSF
jgi:hypothetical protein